MTPENLKLTVMVSKLQYYQQLYEKYGDPYSLRSAEMYGEKAQQLLKEIEENTCPRQSKLYINR